MPAASSAPPSCGRPPRGRQLAHGRASRRQRRTCLAEGPARDRTTSAGDGPAAAALAGSGPVRRPRRPADPHPRRLRRAGPVARLAGHARGPRPDRPDHRRRRPPAGVPLLRQPTPSGAPLRYVRGNHDVGSAWAHTEPALLPEPMPDARLVDEAGLRLIGFSGSPIYSGRGMRGRGQRHVEQGVRWPGCARARARPVLVVSHAPPRDVNDGDDLAHRGFTAFRWLTNRLAAAALAARPHRARAPRHRPPLGDRATGRSSTTAPARRSSSSCRPTPMDEPVPIRRAAVGCLLIALAGLAVALIVRPAIFSFATPRDDSAVVVATAAEVVDGPVRRDVLLTRSYGWPGEIDAGDGRVQLSVIVAPGAVRRGRPRSPPPARCRDDCPVEIAAGRPRRLRGSRLDPRRGAARIRPPAARPVPGRGRGADRSRWT